MKEVKLIVEWIVTIFNEVSRVNHILFSMDEYFIETPPKKDEIPMGKQNLMLIVGSCPVYMDDGAYLLILFWLCKPIIIISNIF